MDSDAAIDLIAQQLVRLGRIRERTNAQIHATSQGEIEVAAYGIIFKLLHDGPMRSGELAEALYSDASTISRQVAGLVKRGLIERRADPDDGRASVLVVTDDGRTASGFLVDRDSQVLVLRSSEGQNMTIPQQNIDQTIPQRKSLMPEGLLKDYSDQQVRNLFAYLRSTQPLNE